MREKLIELVKQGYNKYFNPNWALDFFAIIADHLIAHGVTINEDCHWATEQAYKNGYSKGKADALKWIPVTDRLPEKKGSYLTYNSKDRSPNHSIHIAQFIQDDDYWKCVWENCVTHWMPLPEPPKT